MKETTDSTGEKAIEMKLRKNKVVIPFITLLMSSLLLFGIALCMKEFRAGYYWTIIPSAFLAHAFFIVAIHDGAHRSITRSWFDSFIMNLGAGIMLLPFYAEPFRKYHLIHHVNTNNEHDPLWTETKNRLYMSHRFFYILCMMIPLLFTAYLVFFPDKIETTTVKKNSNIKMRIPYMVFSFAVAIVTYWIVQPPLFFILGTLFILNFLSALRHWCEHMGIEENKESNTFWFPLGMGIGNHEVHHDHPHYSWLTLSVGLFSRKKDTNPFKTFFRILFKRSFSHYKYIKPE